MPFIEVRVTRQSYGGRTEWVTPSWLGSFGTRAAMVAQRDVPARGFAAMFFEYTGTLPAGARGTQHYRYRTRGSLDTRLSQVGTWT